MYQDTGRFKVNELKERIRTSKETVKDREFLVEFIDRVASTLYREPEDIWYPLNRVEDLVDDYKVQGIKDEIRYLIPIREKKLIHDLSKKYVYHIVSQALNELITEGKIECYRNKDNATCLR